MKSFIKAKFLTLPLVDILLILFPKIIKASCPQKIECSECSEESIKLNQCIKCNISNGYFPINYNNNYNEKYLNCYHQNSSLVNFYFDTETKYFEPCYGLCNTCSNHGDIFDNNCTTCINNYILISDNIYPNNCVIQCKYYYYFDVNNQYKCTDNQICPKNYPYLSINKCLDNCKNSLLLKYSFNNICYFSCPEGTVSNNDNICEIENNDKCFYNKNFLMSSYDEINDEFIDMLIYNYANEFKNNDNVVLLYSDFFGISYSIFIYKNINCLKNISDDYPFINFTSCYNKIKNIYQIKNELIITLIYVWIDKYDPERIFSFYSPITLKKLFSSNSYDNNYCNDSLILKEINLIHSSYFNYSLITILNKTNELIDLNGPLLNDDCFQVVSNNGLDVPLRDREYIYNIFSTLCSDNCTNKGLNLTSMRILCECNSGYFLMDSVYYILNSVSLKLEFEKAFQELYIQAYSFFAIVYNIRILGCYSNIIKFNNLIKNLNGYIIFILIIIQSLFVYIFFKKESIKVNEYIISKQNKFIKIIENEGIIKKNNNEILKKNNSLPNSVESNIINNDINKKNSNIIKINYKLNENLTKENNNSENRSLKKLNEKFNISDKTNNILILSNDLRNSKYEKINNKINKDSINNKKFIPIYIDEAIGRINYDDLNYTDMIIRDERTFFEILKKRLMTKILIVNLFDNNDLIPRSLKVIFLICIVNIFFIISILIFNYLYKPEIYLKKSKGFLDYISFSIITLATIIGKVVQIVINWLFLNENKMRIILNDGKKDFEKLKKDINKFISKAKIHYIISIIFTYIIAILTLYYVSCFDSVYTKSKFELIKMTVYSIFSLEAYSLGVSLLFTICRKLSILLRLEFLNTLSTVCDYIN